MQQRLENKTRQQHTRDHLQSSNLVHALFGKEVRGDPSSPSSSSSSSLSLSLSLSSVCAFAMNENPQREAFLDHFTHKRFLSYFLPSFFASLPPFLPCLSPFPSCSALQAAVLNSTRRRFDPSVTITPPDEQQDDEQHDHQHQHQHQHADVCARQEQADGSRSELLLSMAEPSMDGDEVCVSVCVYGTASNTRGSTCQEPPKIVFVFLFPFFFFCSHLYTPRCAISHPPPSPFLPSSSSSSSSFSPLTMLLRLRLFSLTGPTSLRPS